MNFARISLMYIVLPAWIAAGFADWGCHRRSHIEATSGWRESAFHFVMFVQMGMAGLAALLLQVNSASLLLLAALLLLHELTVWLELRYVFHRRAIVPAEQMVHSFLELLPFAGVLLLLALPERTGDWTLRLKEQPLPAAYLVTVCAAIAMLNLLPLLEEAWRCQQAERERARAR